MTVAPKFQRRGIGALLVREGLERCHAVGAEAVVVIGHAEYYPQFGFRPAHGFGLRCEYDVPLEVFIALELVLDFAALARWSRPDQATGPGRPASRSFAYPPPR
jgi:putative acetyltransferase